MCEGTTQPAPERRDPASLVVAPDGHEWRAVDAHTFNHAEPGVGMMVAEPPGPRRWFVAVPVPVWPDAPGEYRMRRADGQVVTALLANDGTWVWLDEIGNTHAVQVQSVRTGSLLSPVVEGGAS